MLDMFQCIYVTCKDKWKAKEIYFNGNKAKDRMKFCNCSKKKKKCFKEVSNTVYVQKKK